MNAILLAALLGQWANQGMLVKDEGTNSKYAKQVNCVGAGVSCASNGLVWTLTVPGGAGPTLPLSGANGGLGQAQPTCGAGSFLSCNGTLCSCSSAGVPALPLSGANGGLGQAQPTCSAGQHVSCNGTTCSCTADTGGGGAPTTSKYLLQQTDASLPNAQAMASLGTGLVKNTTTTGVQSIASAGTDYAPGTSANGTGLVLSTNGTGALTAYGGATCTNQFPRSLSASGAPTCSSVALGTDVSGTLALASVAAPSGDKQVHYTTGTSWGSSSNFTFDPATGAVGIGAPTILTGNPFGVAGSASGGTVQLNVQNKAAGTSASSDVVATADTGTDSTNYIDMGINSSTYADTNYTIGGALSGYMYSNGGDLTIGTQTAAKVLKLHTGGTLAANLRATLSDTALTLASGVSLALASATNGGSAYGTGTALAFTAAGTAGQVLMSNGAGAPTWSNRMYGFRVSGSNYTNSTTTVSNITGLAVTVGSGESGSIRCQLAVTNANAASAIRYGVNGPGMTNIVIRFSHVTTTVATPTQEVFTAVSAAVQTAAVTSGVATTEHVDTIEITYLTSASGTIQVIAAGSAAQLHTVFQGSSCMVQ